MVIDFICSGGFANLRLDYRANTDELPMGITKEILRLTGSSGIFDIQPNQITPSSVGPPDTILYQLTLTDGDRKTSLNFNDVTAPTELRPLLELLQKLAIQQS